MAKRVLIPVDDSERREQAVELTFDLLPGGTVVLLHVINPAEVGFSSEEVLPSFSEGWYEEERTRAEEAFDEIEELAAGHDVSVERHIELGRPAGTILDAVTELDVDHIVMGSRGRRGVSRILLGSVAEAVVRRSDVPVTVAR